MWTNRCLLKLSAASALCWSTKAENSIRRNFCVAMALPCQQFPLEAAAAAAAAAGDIWWAATAAADIVAATEAAVVIGGLFSDDPGEPKPKGLWVKGLTLEIRKQSRTVQKLIQICFLTLARLRPEAPAARNCFRA